MDDWPDDGPGFLRSRGWELIDCGGFPAWQEPKERYQAPALTKIADDADKEGKVVPRYQITERPLAVMNETAAVHQQLASERPHHKPITEIIPAFSEADMEKHKQQILARRQAPRGKDTPLTMREQKELEDYRKETRQVIYTPCSGCGSWPDAYQKEKR
jgi:hypothetical protein